MICTTLRAVMICQACGLDKKIRQVETCRIFWRKRWDSNPRAREGYLISSPQCEMEVNRKNWTLSHFIYPLRKIPDRLLALTIITDIRTHYNTLFFRKKRRREWQKATVEPSKKALYIKGFRHLLSIVASGFRIRRLNLKICEVGRK